MVDLDAPSNIQGPGFLKRNVGIVEGSAGLPLGAVIGIGVGGAILMLVVLTPLAILLAKKIDRRKAAKQSTRADEEQVDIKSALRSTQPPEISFLRRISTQPFLLLGSGNPSTEWLTATSDAGNIQVPPLARVKKPSDQRGLRRLSGMRDSWPLVSSIPLSILPPQQKMVLNQVGGGGYMVPPSPENGNKWPRRSSSRYSTNKVIVHFPDSDFRTESTEELQPKISPVRPRIQYRSTSESHLSTILRSTSQRLKAAQKESLTRTMSTFRQVPKWRQSSMVSSKISADSGEEQITSHDDLDQKSPRPSSSIYESNIDSSPILHERLSQQIPPSRLKHERPRSHTPSSGSSDSLCETQTPDLIIPALLTSPSRRNGKQDRRLRMSISQDTKDLNAIIRKNGKAASMIIADRQAEDKPVFSRISLASDPFYSSVKSSKPIFPTTRGPDTRPLYVRKATFGQEATAERPLSYTSNPDRPLSYTLPLKDVSGNAQSPLRRNPSRTSVRDTRPVPDPCTDYNPFQWSPKEAMKTAPSVPSPKKPSALRKGHKRSKTVRLSVPRPSSAMSVDVVPEELEDEASLPSLIFRPASADPEQSTSARSLSPIRSSRRLSLHPPTSATFNPSVVVPELTSRSTTTSPTLGEIDVPQIYSPTMSVCNYYAECDSENEFFGSKSASAAELKLRRHGRNYSADFPQGIPGVPSFPSFFPAKISPPSSPPSRPLPSITTSAAGLVHSKSPGPAPPLLTMPIPGHLTGPRPEPSKHNSLTGSEMLSPQRSSVGSSICLLRRMNSDISRYSMMSDGSPDLQSRNERERRVSRGSRHYLSVGASNPRAPDRNTRVTKKRDSHKIYEERRRKRMDEDALMSSLKDLTPVREGSSPSDNLGLQFPTISSTTGKTGISPKKPNTDTSSDTPVATSVRRESKMEHPSPQTPPKWEIENKRLSSVLKMSEQEQGKARPESPGLYDQDGFLKSSPGREPERERFSAFLM